MRPYRNPYAEQNMNYSYPWIRGAEQGMWLPGMDEDREEKRDMEYWKQLYPAQTRRVQREVEHQCDLLEYDGSVMYDEYPDRIALARICEAVYQALMQENTGNAMAQYPAGMPENRSNSGNALTGNMPVDMGNGEGIPDDEMMEDESPLSDDGIMSEEESEEAYDFRSPSGLEMMQMDRRDRSIQDLIEVLLYNEIHRRRRRRRRHRSWYFGS